MYTETIAEGWLRLALTPGMDIQSAHALLSEFGVARQHKVPTDRQPK